MDTSEFTLACQLWRKFLTKLVLAQIAETQDSHISNFHLKNAKKTPFSQEKGELLKGNY